MYIYPSASTSSQVCFTISSSPAISGNSPRFSFQGTQTPGSRFGCSCSDIAIAPYGVAGKPRRVDAAAKDRRINNCPVLVCDHHAERDGYFEIATVIDAPILSADEHELNALGAQRGQHLAEVGIL